MRTLLVLMLLVAALALPACDDPQALKTQEAKEQLVGSWMRDIEAPDAKGRRLLVLADDGTFVESLAVEFADGHIEREEKRGEWAFDGTNLKRRYTYENGRQLVGIGRFVTFAITSLTPRAFDGKNFVQGEEVHYRRVPPGTLP